MQQSCTSEALFLGDWRNEYRDRDSCYNLQAVRRPAAKQAEVAKITEQSQSPTARPTGSATTVSWRGWAIVVAILALWQLGWALGVIPPIGLPSPLEIAIALWQLVNSGELWFHLEATLPRLAFGWGLGVVLSLLVFWVCGRWRAMNGVVAALISLVAAVPAIALLPLFMIWMGAGEAASVAAITVAALVPGTRAILAEPPDEPRLTPGHAIDALRAALPYAMAVLVAVEMIAGGFGIGALLLAAVDLARSDQILAGCIVLALIGLALNQLLRTLSKRV